MCGGVGERPLLNPGPDPLCVWISGSTASGSLGQDLVPRLRSRPRLLDFDLDQDPWALTWTVSLDPDRVPGSVSESLNTFPDLWISSVCRCGSGT